MIEKKVKKNKIRKKGSALAYGLIIMFAVSIILVSILQFVSSQMKYSIYKTSKEQAFQLAEAGTYFYRWYLAHETSALSAKQLSDFWSSGDAIGTDPSESYIVDFPEGNPIGSYQIEVIPPEPNSTILTVKSTGWTYKEPNSKRIVQVRFRKPSWSEYAVVTDSYIRFGEGTLINGKIHSNKGIRFDGVAQNLITSAVNIFDDPDHSGSPEFGVHTHKGTVDPLPPAAVPVRSDVFVAGRQFEVANVSFTGFSTDNDFMKDQAQEGLSDEGCTASGCYFDDSREGREIILRDDGKFEMRIVRSYDADSFKVETYQRLDKKNKTCSSRTDDKCLKVFDIPDDGVIFVENNVWIEGKIIDRRVTIVASNNSELNPTSYGKDIYIGKGNLNYTNYDGQDIIGLVAQKDITVIEDSANNLTIDAALLAQNGRVGRNYYGSSPYSYSCKNSITVNGSIATKERYGFAWTGNDCNCGGFSVGSGYCVRDLNFDNDLLYYPPPNFPTGDAYAIDLWEEL